MHESLADFSANRDLKGWVSADEVADTKPLFEEIRKISEENQLLKETLATMEKRTIAASAKSIDKKTETYEELEKVLDAIKVKVPAALSGGKETTRDLLSLFFNNKEILINGDKCSRCIRSSDISLSQHLSEAPGTWAHRERECTRRALST